MKRYGVNHRVTETRMIQNMVSRSAVLSASDHGSYKLETVLRCIPSVLSVSPWSITVS